MKAVFENRLPIRLSSRPDYSDAIGMADKPPNERKPRAPAWSPLL
jgi:hypothetical protein